MGKIINKDIVIISITNMDFIAPTILSLVGAGFFKLVQYSHDSNINDIKESSHYTTGLPKQTYSHASPLLESGNPRTYVDQNGISYTLMAIKQTQDELVEKKVTTCNLEGETRDYTNTETRTSISQGKQYFSPIETNSSNPINQVLDKSFYPYLPFEKIFSSLKTTDNHNVNVNVNNEQRRGEVINKTPIGIRKTISGVKDSTIFTVIGDFTVEDAKVVMRPSPDKFSIITTKSYQRVLLDETSLSDEHRRMSNTLLLLSGVLALCGISMKNNNEK